MGQMLSVFVDSNWTAIRVSTPLPSLEFRDEMISNNQAPQSRRHRSRIRDRSHAYTRNNQSDRRVGSPSSRRNGQDSNQENTRDVGTERRRVQVNGDEQDTENDAQISNNQAPQRRRRSSRIRDRSHAYTRNNQSDRRVGSPSSRRNGQDSNQENTPDVGTERRRVQVNGDEQDTENDAQISNNQAPQRRRSSRIRDRSHPYTRNNQNDRRVGSPSSRRNGQDLNQENTRDVGTERRRVQVNGDEQDTENDAQLSNDARVVLNPPQHPHSKTSEEPHEVKTNDDISEIITPKPKCVLRPRRLHIGYQLLLLTDPTKIADSLIGLAKCLKTANFDELCCLTCRQIPILPITGQCGHTRCTRCVVDKGDCPCGEKAPKSPAVNTVVREIIDKLSKYTRQESAIEPELTASDYKPYPLVGDNTNLLIHRHGVTMETARSKGLWLPQMPMNVQARHFRAQQLLAAGNYMEAASHLVRVAASSDPCSESARNLLIDVIRYMATKKPYSTVSQVLRQRVREQQITFVTQTDLECVLCTNPYACPVTTPCGHTFCRQCIEHSLHYSRMCPLCKSDLDDFPITRVRDTVFIRSVLSSMGEKLLPNEKVVMPVITCHVAYPGMPCPLIVLAPPLCEMVQQILQSGSRRFGMLSGNSPNYGTVLEIRDCVMLEDGRCILSTLGVYRFRIIEINKCDGIDIGRIQRLTDLEMDSKQQARASALAMHVHLQAMTWLSAIYEAKRSVRDEIDTAFGVLPAYLDPTMVMDPLDGPVWLWYIIAILPHNEESKTLLLTTRSVWKRLAAVSTALDMVTLDTALDSDVTILTSATEIATV